MTSITRKILGVDKDICYFNGDKLVGIILNNKLVSVHPAMYTNAEGKLLQKTLKKAKQRDGVACAQIAIGEIGYDEETKIVHVAINSVAVDTHFFDSRDVIELFASVPITLDEAESQIRTSLKDAQLDTKDRPMLNILVEQYAGNDLVFLALLLKCGNYWKGVIRVDNMINFGRAFANFAFAHNLHITVDPKLSGKLLGEVLAGGRATVVSKAA